jgi:hypothetical protein
MSGILDLAVGVVVTPPLHIPECGLEVELMEVGGLRYARFFEGNVPVKLKLKKNRYGEFFTYKGQQYYISEPRE